MIAEAEILHDLPAWISAFAAVVGVLIAAGGLFYAGYQLHGLTTTLKLNRLGLALNLETEIHQRKSKLNEISAVIDELAVRRTDSNEKKMEIKARQLQAELESYLNALDRLAFCIQKNYFEEKDWKAEYRGFFSTVVNDHKDQFDVASPYTNIKDLHAKWSREG